MDISTITQLIGSLGFPIVMCGALFWKMNKQDESHKEEISELKKSIDNNTAICARLYEHIGGTADEEAK